MMVEKVSIGENDQNTSFAGILIVFEYLNLNQKLGRLYTLMKIASNS
jgi:hypothetical protein